VVSHLSNQDLVRLNVLAVLVMWYDRKMI
jgi:hypothetical protein